jgi:hypothetical protein
MIGEKVGVDKKCKLFFGRPDKRGVNEIKDASLNNQDTYLLVVAAEEGRRADAFWVNPYKETFVHGGIVELSWPYFQGTEEQRRDYSGILINSTTFFPSKLPHFWSKEARIIYDQDALSKYQETE